MHLQMTYGQIYWNQTPIHSIASEYRSVLGYMPQQQGMYPFFSASEFLFYMTALHGMKKDAAVAAVREALLAVDLFAYANQKIRTFSGGMQQRLLLAQAIVANPKVLVLDEPTAGLDPYQRIEIRNLIARMAMGRIILIATHVVQDIDVIAKEILLLKDGKLVEKGSPSDLRKKLNGKMNGKNGRQIVWFGFCFVFFFWCSVW